MPQRSLVWHKKHLIFLISCVKPKLTLLRRTCREAAALLIAREDRVLSLPDHVALKLHLFACKACPKFETQVLTLRTAMGKWRHYSEESEAAMAAPPPELPPR